MIMDNDATVPAQLRIDNGYFYNKALEDHPWTKINNTRLLATSLITTMKYAKITEFDIEIARGKALAVRAWSELKRENNEGKAIQTAQEAMEHLMFFLYDKRFADPESASFTGRGDK
jgi:phage gpG-like protein